MKNCNLQSDLRTAAWYEQEIQKIDPEILALKIARPALRALINAAIYTAAKLRATPFHTLKALHGMGPSALKKLETLYA
ncbi:MAG: hypothetical protein U0X40_11705 [Ferruginibacter sp.]